MAKRAFLIIAPEGCGSYMLAEAFVSAGCTYCDKDDIEEFLKEQQPDLLVVRRSLPHAGEWPNIPDMHQTLKDFGYEVWYYSIVRDGFCATMSVKRRRRNSDTKQLVENYHKALEQLTSPTLSYEYFVLSPQYRKFIFADAGLPPPEMEFYDGNEKYFK